MEQPPPPQYATAESTPEHYYLNSVQEKSSTCYDSISCDKQLPNIDSEDIRKLDCTFRNSHKNMPHGQTQVKTHIGHYLVGYQWQDTDYRLSMNRLTEAFQETGKPIHDLLLNSGYVWLKLRRSRLPQETYVNQGDFDLTPGDKVPSSYRYINTGPVNCGITGSTRRSMREDSGVTRKRRKIEVDNAENRLPKTPPGTQEQYNNWTPIFNPPGLNGGNIYEYYSNQQASNTNCTRENVMQDDLHLVNKIISGSEEESKNRLRLWESLVTKTNNIQDCLPEQISRNDRRNVIHVHNLFRHYNNGGLPLFSSISIIGSIKFYTLCYQWKDVTYLLSALDLYEELMKNAPRIVSDVMINANSIVIKIVRVQP